jgi:hypothetical protein
MAGDAQARADRAAEQAAQRMARKLAGIAEAARRPPSVGFEVPILDADPEADDPTNLWLFADGRMRVRTPDGTVHTFWPGFRYLTLDSGPAASTGIDFYRHRASSEWRVRRPDGTWERYAPISAADGGSRIDPGGTSTTPKPADPKVVKRSATYSATWARSMCPVHGAESGGSLYFGRWSATHGQRRVMLGLNDSAIRSDLAGATIREVWIKMRTDHFYANAGGEVRFGAHNKSSAPGGYSSVRERVFADHWPKSGYGKEWRRAPDWFGNALRDGTIRGLTINQRSDSSAFYGAMAWGTFRLRIVYTVEV